MSSRPVDVARLTGLDLPEERLVEVLQAFEDIQEAIEKLRELDLSETHPAVVFYPVGTDNTQ